MGVQSILWSYRVCRWVIGGIFIFSGMLKMMEPAVFAVLIDAYGIVPAPILFPLAIVIPLLEVVAGIGLWFDVEKCLQIICGLLMLFIAILGYGIRLGLDIDCGCFGPEDPEAKAFHGLKLALYRDIAMMGACFFIFWARRQLKIQTIKLKSFMKRKRNVFV